MRDGRLYYGWILVLALGVTETTSWGILYYTFTVFVTPMEAELGWSRAAMTGAFSAALLLSGVAAVPIGRWLDRHGARLVMTLGSCAGTLLLLAWSAVRDLALFYLIWAGIGVAMAAVLYEPAFAVVAKWFHRRRSQALTAITLMGGLASAIFLPLAAWLVEVQGWRAALITLALILGIVTIPTHALLLRRRPEDLGLYPDGDPARGPSPARGDAMAAGAPGARTLPGYPPTGGASGRLAGPDASSGCPASLPPPSGPPRTPAASRGASAERGGPLSATLRLVSFRWLAVAFCLNRLVTTAVAVHLVPYLAGRGLDPAFAATAAGSIGVMQVVGRLFFVPLGRLLPRRAVPAIVLLLEPLALLVLLLTREAAGLYTFIALFGAGRGLATLARASLVADLYGPARYGTISGVLTLLYTLAQAAGPIGVGAAFDAFGRYEPGLWSLAALGAAAAFAVAQAGRPAVAAAASSPPGR